MTMPGDRSSPSSGVKVLKVTGAGKPNSKGKRKASSSVREVNKAVPTSAGADCGAVDGAKAGKGGHTRVGEESKRGKKVLREPGTETREKGDGEAAGVVCDDEERREKAGPGGACDGDVSRRGRGSGKGSTGETGDGGVSSEGGEGDLEDEDVEDEETEDDDDDEGEYESEEEEEESKEEEDEDEDEQADGSGLKLGVDANSAEGRAALVRARTSAREARVRA